MDLARSFKLRVIGALGYRQETKGGGAGSLCLPAITAAPSTNEIERISDGSFRNVEGPHGTTAQNDDVVSLSMSKDNLYVVWGDQRAGFLGTSFGRSALSAYKFQ